MRTKDLEVALDRYGGDLTRWPAKLAGEAEALIAGDADAARMAAAARALDATLDEAMQPLPVDAAFLGRITAHVGETPQHEVAVRATPRFAAWAGAAMVAFLVTGYAVGATLPDGYTQDDDAPLAGLLIGSDTGDSASGVATVDTGSQM